jgi:hypothetical protein
MAGALDAVRLGEAKGLGIAGIGLAESGSNTVPPLGFIPSAPYSLKPRTRREARS